VPLHVYDESIGVLRRALDAASLGRSEKLDGFRRLDAFTRAIENRHTPDADVAAVIDHEREAAPAHGGRTVFDDRPAHCKRPPGRGQLSLFDP
jgi:hypothetical protein